MAADHFFHEVGDRGLSGSSSGEPLLEKSHGKEKVTEFGAHFPVAITCERCFEFVSLIDEVLDYAQSGLFLVPGAPFGSDQNPHQGAQLLLGGKFAVALEKFIWVHNIHITCPP